jgi:hypothetical protein
VLFVDDNKIVAAIISAPLIEKVLQTYEPRGNEGYNTNHLSGIVADTYKKVLESVNTQIK